MSLQLLAKQMESKGRDGDSVLVHMTHGEVAGLQKLAESAGGSLSVNPETGLVEANFLKQMLPTIVGLAVGVGTGNPMLGAAAGAAVGGYQARRNDQDVGMGMVMGGMGGYGGASLAGGLSAAAPAAAGSAPVSAAGSTVIPGAGAGIMAPTAATSIGAAPTAQAANVATQAATAPTMAENFARFGQGFQGMGTEAGRAAALKSMGGSEGVMNAMQMAALPALNAADAYDTTPGPHPLLSTDLNQTGGGAFQDIRAYEPAMPRYTAQRGNVYIPTFSAAEGGLATLAKGGMESGGFVVPADVVSMVGEGNTDAGYKRIKSMVPGATAIKGKDGGQADTVKTSIEGKQPARVAHGEMYVPPETVKRMGGAKKLYAMMDRVREQATGSKKQIKPVSLKQAMA
jgi:hypothetical protein